MNIDLHLKIQRQVTLAKKHLLRDYNIFKTFLGEHHSNTQKAILIVKNLDEMKKSEIIKLFNAKQNLKRKQVFDQIIVERSSK